MGILFVLFSPCFRENVVVTCKTWSPLHSSDNSPQKNAVVLLFGNQTSKWLSFEKRAIPDPPLTFSSHQGKLQNSPSTHLTHIHTCILLTLLTVFASPILKKKKKTRIHQVWPLSGMNPGVDSYSETINIQQNGEQNLSWNVHHRHVSTAMPNLQSFATCGPRMTGAKTQLNGSQWKVVLL